MRRTTTLLATLAVLSQLTGCTSFQAKEAGRGIAGSLFGMVMDIATDGPERRLEERRRWEDNPANRWETCLPPCEIITERQDRRAAAEAAELEEKAQRKREREVLHYKKEADAIIDAIDESEWQSGQLQPESATTDYEQQEEERLLQRDKTLEHQAEFDAFMRNLEKAEQQSDDPPSITTTSQ
jgi:hypothetical protein